jgi:nitrogenase molybdenum-iron protein alpha/beta subunit
MISPLNTGQSTRRSFLLGVYLATNAIADAATVVDGPDCTFFKAEYIHGRHDLNSRLLDALGHHRILVTHTTTDDIAQSVGQQVVQRIEDAQRLGGIGLVLVTAMPMVSIIGLQYDRLIRTLGPLSLEVVAVEGRSLQGDWLDGYADVLTALSDKLEPDPRPPATDSVSIIGHFMDRNEEDGRGNVRELRRLVEGLGLRLETVWCGGEDWASMRRASRSSTLVSFPLGVEAAHRLAARTGARVVDLETPLGLTRSMDFVRELGAATGRTREAEQLMELERGRCVAPLEWVIPHYFLGLRVAISATPDLLPGLWDLLTELGVEVVEATSPSRPRDGCAPEILGGLEVGFDVDFDRQRWDTTKGPELIIGDTWAARPDETSIPMVELGFPSYLDHALLDRPYLGFRGHTALIQRCLSALATGGGRPTHRER